MEDLIDLSDYQTPDSEQKATANRVRFYKKSVLNKLKTYGGSKLDEFGKPRKDAKGDPMTYEAAGRPIYEQVDYIEVRGPDAIDKHNVPARPATEADKRAYRKAYQAFLARNEKVADGMPLEMWPLIEAHQVDELRYLGVHTVEKLARLKAGDIPDIGGLEQLVNHANDYLNAAKGASPATQLRAALSKQAVEMDALRKQMAELMAAKAGEAPAAPKKRGRPAKTTNTEGVANGDV